jgi:hypothetical protein
MPGTAHHAAARPPAPQEPRFEGALLAYALAGASVGLLLDARAGTLGLLASVCAGGSAFDLGHVARSHATYMPLALTGLAAAALMSLLDRLRLGERDRGALAMHGAVHFTVMVVCMIVGGVIAARVGAYPPSTPVTIAGMLLGLAAGSGLALAGRRVLAGKSPRVNA